MRATVTAGGAGWGASQPHAGRREASRFTWRVRRVAIVAASLVLVPGLVSYLAAIAGPSNSSLGVRSVEWLRDHGGAGLVSQIESIYYSFTAPSKGGPALRKLPHNGYATATAGAAASAGTARPADVAPLVQPALPGEGQWRPTRLDLGANPPVMVTTFRSDPLNYPRLVAGIAWVDPTRTSITLYPGRLEPSVSLPGRGPMQVPPARQQSLLATFNSGFKLSDSHGGFALNGRAYAPMQDGMATIVGYYDGRVDVLAWQSGPSVPADVAFARQNLPLIVEGGRPNPNLSDGPEWGATLGNAVRVWRSGVGITAQGDLVYAAANYQTVGSLADVLIRAGAVRAMELDINSYWTTFISYGAAGAGAPASLLPDMSRAPMRYLSPDDRDFFAVNLR